MEKIRFKSSAKTEIIDSLVMMKDGFRLLLKVMVKLFNKSAHRYPYAYFALLIVGISIPCVATIMSARAERDHAVKKAYLFEQKLDSINMLNEAKAEVSYVYHEN